MERQQVVQKKTGLLLGYCDPVCCRGKYYTLPYATKQLITSIKFRYQFPHPLWQVLPRLIAHGYRDAGMLPGFKRLEHA